MDNNRQGKTLLVENAFVQAAGLSHQGKVRLNNEDRWQATVIPADQDSPSAAMLAVLADGVGGQQGGETAAQIAVDTIMAWITTKPLDNAVQALESAIQEANAEIFRQSQQENSLRGMSSTVVCALLVGKRLYTAFLGDSRIYLVQKESIQQTSRDHTWLEEAQQAGLTGADKLTRSHPLAHVLNRYLGTPFLADVDMRLFLSDEENDQQAIANQGYALNSGNHVILASDRLTDLLSAAEILLALQTQPLVQVPQALIDIAIARGGHDNTTVVALKVR